MTHDEDYYQDDPLDDEYSDSPDEYFLAFTDDDFDARTVEAGADDEYAPPASAPDDDFHAVTVELESAAPRRAHPIPAAPAATPPLRRPPAHPRAARRRKPPTPASAWLITLRTMLVVVAAAILVSTIFSLWTRPTFFSDEFRAGLNQVQATQRVINIQPSPLPTDVREVRIGIVAGHSGRPQDTSFEVDPGATCPDGLTELEINEAVAREVVAALRRERYTVDLLQEFDSRLAGYQADVLVSIHTNDCQDYGDAGTGYSVASASARQTTRGADEYLLTCLIEQYGATTGLPRHQGLTYDMTEYHTFGEVAVDTPTAIIEIGFMRNDRAMLTGEQALIGQGIANGIRCFLRPELYGGADIPG